MYVTEERSLEEVKEKMGENNIRVAIINTKHPIYKELLIACDGGYYLSVCRDGIFTYANDIMKVSKKPTAILCFDNDELTVFEASQMCTGSNVSIHKCVAHGVCAEAKVDKEGNKVVLYGCKEKILFFQPEVAGFEKFLNRQVPLSQEKVHLRFTATKEEFSFLVDVKLLLNAMHTALCSLAIKEGVRRKLPLEEISKMRVLELLDAKKVIPVLEDIYSELFNELLLETAEKLGEFKEVYTDAFRNFIKHLFKSEHEPVGRGYDVSNSLNAYSKLKRHLPFLRRTKNGELNEALDFIERNYLLTWMET